MSLDLSNLPFENKQTMSVHRVSDAYIEFFDEPKLKLHRYGEKNRPYLSNWFALSSDWFPDNQYLVFDHRVAIDLKGSPLPFKNEDKLTTLADLIIKQHGRLIDFIKHVVETKALDGAEIEAVSRLNNKTVISDTWAAMQPESQGIISRFYQTENIDEFIWSCEGMDSNLTIEQLKVLYECLTDVCRTERDLRDTILKAK
ncbi:hypothetical protein [Pseudoalteromonas sp. Of11M-6]|uniref:hypothetical protein n=1 Tax=Pseudoalteromonas sp. Of11M-6 TaxID=2917754 RepID=UPI001EF68361|nr:hypothetical protein [Pseudoalteromonas sp. Of11M-6]MCG7556071.1 hypothetical protein [Pseudoalteromonas sp. Of11M-6]